MLDFLSEAWNFPGARWVIVISAGLGLKLLQNAVARKPLKPVVDEEKDRLRKVWEDANRDEPANWWILVLVVAMIFGSISYAILTEKAGPRPSGSRHQGQ